MVRNKCVELLVALEFGHVFLLQANISFYSITRGGIHEENQVLESQGRRAKPCRLAPSKISFIQRKPAQTSETECNHLSLDEFCSMVPHEIQELAALLLEYVSSRNLHQFSLFALLPDAPGHNDPLPTVQFWELLWQRKKDSRKKILVVAAQILAVGSLHDAHCGASPVLIHPSWRPQSGFI